MVTHHKVVLQFFFSSWLSLSWRFFFINTHSSNPFFITTIKECYMFCMHHSYFSHFYLKGNLICFQSLMIINDAAVSTHEHASLCIKYKRSHGEIRRNQIAGPQIYIFLILTNTYLSSWINMHSDWKRSHFSTP